MEQTGFIVGIDLGTSKITGLVGRRNEQGVISIIASETIPSDFCIRHGVIYNIDEAAGKTKRLLHLLENKIGKKIGKTYVSIAGKSLRAVEHVETKRFPTETPVSFAILDQMEQQARSNKPDLLSNYSVVSPETYLDGKFVEDPIDKLATTIEVRYRLIAGRPNIKSNLIKCFQTKNQIDIAGYIIGPVSTGAIILDEEDKNAGCALVDFGAGTTTLSIYKDGLLRYMVVIPFGGRTITKDVEALGFTHSMAEGYKIKYGRVGKDKLKAQKLGRVESEVDVKELNKVIQLRVDEIILNVINQINESGYANQLEAGIIVTGGASQLTGLIDYFSDKAKVPVKQGKIKRLYINNVSDLLQDPSYTQSLGLMLFAKDNCEKIEVPKPIEIPVEKAPEPEPEPETPKKQPKDRQNNFRGLFDKLSNLGGTMFKDED